MTITDRIEALMTEAGEAGDAEQVAICQRALAGDADAIAECQRVMGDAAAQDDTPRATFALLADDLRTVVVVYEHTDAQRDEYARRHGRRYVYLPSGGEAGDTVRVNDDGEATVIRRVSPPVRHLDAIPLACSCCETLRRYIAEHLDTGSVLTRADAANAADIVAEFDRIYAGSGGSGIVAEELAAYCAELPEPDEDEED